MTKMFRSMFKIGKKFCFPDVPSTWIPRTIETIQSSQDIFARKDNLAEKCDYDEILIGRSCSSNNNAQDSTSTVRTSTKDGYLWSIENDFEVYKFLTKDTIRESNSVDLKIGKAFDVISLLKGNNGDGDGYLVRNNGDKVDVESLRGKNILVYCFYVPCFWLSDVCNGLRGTFTACSCLNKKAKENSEVGMEMVMVARMRHNWGNDEEAFNHFFSGFPSSWLTVPFSDTLRRDHVCNAIGLAEYPKGVPCIPLSSPSDHIRTTLDLAEDPKGLLVDPNQKVVFYETVFGFNGFIELHDFCDPHSYVWWKSHPQLDFIFDLDSHYVLSTTNSDKKVSVSELKEKLVGLYLCFDGTFIRTLDMISKECKARNQEFEVVLIYLPYKQSVDPLLFQEAINHVLHNFNISDWWVLPFDDFVSRRLWEAGMFSDEDQLVILDPHKKTVDHFAKSVLKWFGIDAYPFTRESLVRRELDSIRAVTLESLLLYGSRDHVLRINDNNVEVVPIAQLKGKYTYLYIDQIERPSSYSYEKMLECYNSTKTKGADDDFEVVFVSITPFDSGKPLPVPMPWLVCPFDIQHSTFVNRKLLLNTLPYIVAFGKDGHVITLTAHYVDKYGPKFLAPPYKHRDLCQDIAVHIEERYDIDMDGYDLDRDAVENRNPYELY